MSLIANIWVDKGSKFYNRSMKLWLEKNDTEMYSTHNEGKSVVAERFIRTFKNKVSKYMTSIPKTCILINQMINTNTTIHIAQSK